MFTEQSFTVRSAVANLVMLLPISPLGYSLWFADEISDDSRFAAVFDRVAFR